MGGVGERSRRRWPRLWLAGMGLLVAGCVGVVDDPAGDATGAFDIVEAGVDYRRVDTRFWVTSAAATDAPSEVIWCVRFQTEADCGPGADPSRAVRVVLQGGSRYFVNHGRSGISCTGFGDFDGDRTFSVRLDTRCLTFGGPPDSSLRFLAQVFIAGVVSDDTRASSPVFLSD
jgi:hypothetical protein